MTSGLVLHVIVLDYFTSMRSVLNLLGGGVVVRGLYRV